LSLIFVDGDGEASTVFALLVLVFALPVLVFALPVLVFALLGAVFELTGLKNDYKLVLVKKSEYAVFGLMLICTCSVSTNGVLTDTSGTFFSDIAAEK
jgi:hypothetical protein